MINRPLYPITLSKALQMPHNSKIGKLFSEDSHLSFAIGEMKPNQVIFAKGHESDPNQGSWAILIENYHLKIVLHEQNEVNSLVFKSTQPIFNTRLRPFISINWLNSSKNIELFLESLPCSFSIDTSQPHYRTSVSQFTGLNITNDPIILGRAATIPDVPFNFYYDLTDETRLSQSMINQYYLPQKDNRVLPELGKILFISDRLGTNSVFEMTEDGNDVNLRYSNGNLYFPTWIDSIENAFTVSTPGVGYLIEGSTLKHSIQSTGLNMTSLIDERHLTGRSVYNIHLLDIKGNPVTQNDLNSFIGLSGNYPYHINVAFSTNPVSKNKFLITRYDDGLVPRLGEISLLTGSENTIISLPYANNGGNYKFFNAKYSPDGTKVGFNAYYNLLGSDYRAYICDVNGANPVLLEQTSESSQTNFCCFSPDGTKVILSRIVSGIGYTNKSHLFIRDLATNEEKQITHGDHNNFQADWKS